MTCNFCAKQAVLFAQVHRWGLGPIQTCNSSRKLAALHALNHRWCLGTIETCIFGAKQAVLFAEIHRWGLGLVETSNSSGKHNVLHAQIHRWGLGPTETCNSGAIVAVLHAQNHRWGLEPIYDPLCLNHPFTTFQRRWDISVGLLPGLPTTSRQINRSLSFLSLHCMASFDGPYHSIGGVWRPVKWLYFG